VVDKETTVDNKGFFCCLPLEALIFKGSKGVVDKETTNLPLLKKKVREDREKRGEGRAF
jgi:hypothetical protein